MIRMRFAKGHGTENDFVILPDPDGALDLTPELVARLCDRRAGIGGDGVLRVVRTAALGADLPARAASSAQAEWFMDYRNADGSIAEMCGNGVRVFARYLLESGLASGDRVDVGTRAGLRPASVEADGEITVDMGRPEVLGGSSAELAGAALEGLRISVGNPHLAVLLDAGADLEGLDLSGAPAYPAADFPDGANLELVRPAGPGRIDMRVHERGSGETRSCGTGIVAAAVAASAAAGDPEGAAATWRVRVPGGVCTVYLDARGARLRGPAVIVAEGDVRPE